MIHKSCDVLPRIFSRRVTPENPRNRFSCYRTWAEQKDNENDKEHKHYFISTEALILFIHRNQWGNTVLFLPPDDWRLLQLIRIRLLVQRSEAANESAAGAGTESGSYVSALPETAAELSWALCLRSLLKSWKYLLKKCGVVTAVSNAPSLACLKRPQCFRVDEALYVHWHDPL